MSSKYHTWPLYKNSRLSDSDPYLDVICFTDYAIAQTPHLLLIMHLNGKEETQLGDHSEHEADINQLLINILKVTLNFSLICYSSHQIHWHASRALDKGRNADNIGYIYIKI